MKKIVCFAVLLCMVSVSLPLFAADTTATASTTVSAPATQTVAVSSEPKKGWGTQSAEKLGRGVSNLAFSIFEIPYRVTKEFERTDPIGAIPSGFLKGAASAVARACAGIFDVGTFFIPTKPIISEYDAGWWTA